MDAFTPFDSEFAEFDFSQILETVPVCDGSENNLIPVPVNADDRLPGVGGYCVVA